MHNAPRLQKATRGSNAATFNPKSSEKGKSKIAGRESTVDLGVVNLSWF